MAIFDTGSKMIFWEVYVANINCTDMLKEVVSSIKVRDILNKPSEAEINVTSKSYVEDIFVENMPIKIKIGYDRFTIPLVFNGMVKNLPEGQAKELLTYRISCVGREVSLANEEKTRTFRIPTKVAIVAQIAMENGLVLNSFIADVAPIPAGYIPIQRGKTDLEFLLECAERWNCLCWMSEPSTLNFMDAEVAHNIGDVNHLPFRTARDLMTYYCLGYRTDKVPCNVESVSWDFNTPKGGGGGSGVRGANELGRAQDPNAFRVVDLQTGFTWELKPEFLAAARRNPALFGTYTWAITSAGPSQARSSLERYYRVYNASVPTHANNIPPAHDGGGFKFEIDLNEGDPMLKPPRNAYLWAGSINPRCDNGNLPGWIFRQSDPAFLKINETELAFEHGIIRTKIGASIGTIFAGPAPVAPVVR